MDGPDLRGYFHLSFRGKTVSTCHEFAAVNATAILACDLHRARCRKDAAIAPAVERTLGKGEVACSNHAGSTIFHMLNNINPLNTQEIVMFNIR